jgi:DNA-binding NarL/FixJ family response regulator
VPAVRVLLVDDHPVVRDGLRAMLTTAGAAEVVGEAASGEQAVREAALCQPDVVVMDLAMPGVGGVEATRQIVRASPKVGVLVLTMHDQDEAVFAAMRAGARGYVLKGASQQELVAAIHAVARGEAIFGPPVASRVLDWFAGRAPKPAAPFPELTAREREVLGLIAQGHNNTVIAQRLHLAPKTVRNLASSVFAKLQVADRAQAMRRALDEGLGG